MSDLTHLRDKANNREIEVEQSVKSNQALTSKAINPVSKESGTVQETPFIMQGTATANNTSPVDTSPVGKQLEKQGNTIIYNQYVAYASTTFTVASVTFTRSGNGWVANGTASASQMIQSNYLYNGESYYAGLQRVKNHKYLMGTVCNNTHITSYEYLTGSFSQRSYGLYIKTASSDGMYSIGVCVEEGYQYDNVYFELRFIDLTQWFNSDIPADLLTNPNHFSWHYNGEYTYSAGERRDCAGRYLECGQSRNIYSPEKTYNRVIPNLEYYYFNSSDTITTITYYDKNKNAISTESVNSGSTFTTPSNCVYISSSVINNVTITLYYSTGDGYDEYYLYVPSISYDTGTERLSKAGIAKDTKASDGMITRRIGTIDLGTLSWSLYSSDNHIFGAVIANKKKLHYPTDNEVVTINCAEYLVFPVTGAPNNTLTVNMSICELYNNFGYIYIRNIACSTVEDITAALNGIILYYELATPTTEQGTAFSENIQINDYSYTAYKDTNNEYVTIPQGTKLFYPADYVLFADSLVKYTHGDVASIALKSDLANKQDKLTQQTDLTPTTQTLTLTANTRYALGTLTALNITFPASANDGDEIIVEFVSGSTATTLTRDTTNAIYNFDSVGSNVFVEFNAQYKVSIGKWVVYSAETTYGV